MLTFFWKIDDISTMKSNFKNRLGCFFRRQKRNILIGKLFLELFHESAKNRNVIFFMFSDFREK